MVVRSLQERIDALPWYHEFDFGDGLHARSRSPHAPGHRLVWKFIERQLDRVDFRDKSVLDIGCWDGYWSFQAERRGAKSVLATDDCSQNWADGQGVHLAKELLRSSVKVRQDVSVYQLASLNEKFDVILFLCVFYHLHDLFYAFTQIRHCCRRDTVVVVEGSAATELGQGELLCNFSNHACEVLPSLGALRQILRAAYFSDASHVFMNPPRPAPAPTRLEWRRRLRLCWHAMSGSSSGIREEIARTEPPAPAPEQRPARLVETSSRLFMTLTPFEGVNSLHDYRPPFGLDRYDPRFRQDSRSDPPTVAARPAA